MRLGHTIIFIVLAVLLGGCGESRTDAPANPPSTAPVPPPASNPAAQTCPVCKHPVPAEAKYCLTCGSRLK
ncbi:MAG: zinc ribbon domain-containing protein [Planctomycetes bacterium]|nr:zinc ribbon domain-containing protein [Planctomycetota bacterium]